MDFLELLRSGRVIIFDGAMGTEIAKHCHCEDEGRSNPTDSTGLPRPLQGARNDIRCNEELNLVCQNLIQGIHEDYIKAGANVIETNTFGANRIVLAEHGLIDKIREINVAAVDIAKRAIDTANVGQQVFIAGDLGPTSKLPTLGHISFDEMVSAYREQAAFLIEAGVDLIQIDTCQDILQTKAAVIACKEASWRVGELAGSRVGGYADVMTCKETSFGVADGRKRQSESSQAKACYSKAIPIVVTITIEPTGTTLLGTEIGAALASLSSMGIDAFGLNCATGPAEMEEYIRYLSENSKIPIAILPNAGLPEIKNGSAHYPLSPEKFAKLVTSFVKDLGVQCVGGCCGTTPEHINALASSIVCAAGNVQRLTSDVSSRATLKRGTQSLVSSLYSTVALSQEPKPLIVGERMNINGSKEFREFILADNFDAAATIAKKQAASGAHVLDLSVAYAGRDEVSDMNEMARRLATASPLPLMIDSTSPDAIEAALKHLGGRSIINSINLEDGGKKAEKIISLADKYGAALVALTIDEEGMALTVDKKVGVAKRLIKLCDSRQVFIDLLAFTLADPKAALAGSGRETIETLKELKRWNLPNVRTILGVSNISYGFKPSARKVLNSVFLHEAVLAGLDSAIVHPAQILPLHKIEKTAVELAKNLIYCKDERALDAFVKHFEIEKAKQASAGTIVTLEQLVLDGDKSGLEQAIVAALKKTEPQDIINKILLPAMQKVGELFGKGEMVLPFVLQSAEVMRTAIDLLAPHMDNKKTAKRGCIVLATVRGDVHDIGKNLVDIILSNNGYKVVNLGVKQPIEVILKAAVEHKADAIGLSGLLVQSCLVMKDDLAELFHRGIKIPVICGGAALTKKFVESELADAYKNPVYYARDAFEGLKVMQNL